MTHPTDALRLVPTKPDMEMLKSMVRYWQSLPGQIPFAHLDRGTEDALIGKAIYTWEAALAAAPASPLPEGGGWRTDFENAPKDGSVFLVAYDDEASRKGGLYSNKERVYEARWNEVKETWSARNGFILHSDATHWMPLPAAPTGDA